MIAQEKRIAANLSLIFRQLIFQNCKIHQSISKPFWIWFDRQIWKLFGKSRTSKEVGLPEESPP